MSWNPGPDVTLGRGLAFLYRAGEANPSLFPWLLWSRAQNPNNCQFFVGGTSLSSPLALGVWARRQSSHWNRLGFASPAPYKNAKPLPNVTSGPGFHDIVGGCNGLYCAVPGYDYVTGSGTFDISQMNSALP